MGLEEEYARDVMAAHKAGIKEKDFVKVASTYAEDGTVMFENYAPAKGRAAIAELLKKSAEVMGEVEVGDEWKAEYIDLGNGHMLVRGYCSLKKLSPPYNYWMTTVCKKVDSKWYMQADASASNKA